MVFSNIYFLFAFLPLNLVFYYLAPTEKLRDYSLIAFSLFFYAWGEPIWICLLIFSASVDYLHGLIIGKTEKKVIKQMALVSSIVLNIGLLIIFKYSGFFVANINNLLSINLQVPAFSLPIGISFYTFQTLSYTIDVYRGEVKAQKKYYKFLLFVSLFHQLVAGPIVRYKDIALEIDNRHYSYSTISDGILRFVTGLSKKVIIANTASEIGTFYLDNSLTNISVVGAWFGILMFSIQIYFDFSGYSDMAIGLGKMMGFTYKENFNYPYISKSVSEFWRRWHISLGSFFRDYIYIPLGGNKKHGLRNLLIVWMVTGLWHGASWNYVLWGLYFGLFILLERVYLNKLLDKLPNFISHVYLIFIAVCGWVLFYFENLGKGLVYLGKMFGINSIEFINDTDVLRIENNVIFIVVAFVLCTPVVKNLVKYILMKFKDSLEPSKYEIGNGILQSSYLVVIMVLNISLLLSQSVNPFLYFRF